MRTRGERVRQRAAQRAALHRPRLDTQSDDAPPVEVRRAPQPERRDWPAIRSKHPTWWQVERVERVNGQSLRYVLIAECRTERAAFEVSDRQQSQVRISRWRDRQAPWLSFRPPREVAE